MHLIELRVIIVLKGSFKVKLAQLCVFIQLNFAPPVFWGSFSARCTKSVATPVLDNANSLHLPRRLAPYYTAIECYATPWRLWRESRILYFFTEPSYPENLPSLFICRDFFSFCPFNHGRACFQAGGAAMSTRTRLKCKKREKIPTNKLQFPYLLNI